MISVNDNLVDVVWGKDKPSRPNEKVKVLGKEFAGKTFQEKLEDLRKELDKKKSAGLIVCTLNHPAGLPSIALIWLSTNTSSRKLCWMRWLGYTIYAEMSMFCSRREACTWSHAPLIRHSIPYNPVFFSYATVTPTTATLYIDESKLTAEVKSHLGNNVIIRPYDAIFEDSKALSESITTDTVINGDKPSINPARKFLISTKASWALSLNLGGEEKVEEMRSPIGDAKAIKNETELQGMRSCHIRDGAALSEYFAWLEEELTVKGIKLDEVEAADKLEQIRS